VGSCRESTCFLLVAWESYMTPSHMAKHFCIAIRVRVKGTLPRCALDGTCNWEYSNFILTTSADLSCFHWRAESVTPYAFLLHVELLSLPMATGQSTIHYSGCWSRMRSQRFSSVIDLPENTEAAREQLVITLLRPRKRMVTD
jgi:hypothetical protein